jgi:sorting nexin-25
MSSKCALSPSLWQSVLTSRKQVNKFLSALSSLPEQTKDSQNNSPVRSKSLPTPTSITAQSSTRQFEAFLRSIPKVKTLGEARRLRADVDREYRLAKTELDGTSSLDRADHDAEKDVKRTKKYLKRLDRARLEVDARITVLSRSPGKVCQLYLRCRLLIIACGASHASSSELDVGRLIRLRPR